MDTVRFPIRTARHTFEATVSLLKRRAWYDGEGDAGGDGKGDTTTTTTSTTSDKSGQKGGNGDVKTFTQEELDKIVGERALRAKEAALKDFLAKHEVADEDTLTNLLKSAKEAEDAKLSEVEKANQRAEAAEAKVKELEAALKAEREGRRQDRLDNAVTLAARNANANDPADVLYWLQTNHAEELQKTMSEDGKMDTKAIDSLVGKAKEAKAYLFQQTQDPRRRTPGNTSDAGGRASEPDKEAKQEAAAQQKRHMRRNF